jgi:hypothetical protein
MGKIAATISVEWGYETHEIGLSARNWAKVKSGEKLKVRGEGYDYEGEFFQDYWYFNDTKSGELRVEYGDDGAVGFNGPIADCTIEES